MSSSIVADAGLSGDILTFIRLLAEMRVRYLTVGGEAVIYHGYPRLTGDVDFFYENTALNSRRLFRALLEFWEGRIPGVTSPEELLEEGIILQFGPPSASDRPAEPDRRSDLPPRVADADSGASKNEIRICAGGLYRLEAAAGE